MFCLSAPEDEFCFSLQTVPCSEASVIHVFIRTVLQRFIQANLNGLQKLHAK